MVSECSPLLESSFLIPKFVICCFHFITDEGNDFFFCLHLTSFTCVLNFYSNFASDHYRRICAVMAGRPIGKNGRPTIISKKKLLANFPNMTLKDLSSNSYTDRKFQTVLLTAKKEAANLCGKDPALVKKPCFQTLRKYRSILKSSVVKKPGVQTES